MVNVDTKAARLCEKPGRIVPRTTPTQSYLYRMKNHERARSIDPVPCESRPRLETMIGREELKPQREGSSDVLARHWLLPWTPGANIG
jgi:hypothetical protein